MDRRLLGDGNGFGRDHDFSKVGEKEEETMVAWWHSGGCLFRIVFNGRSQLDIQRNAILKKRAGKSSKSKQKR
jgi:hypothetical protein